MFPVAVTLTPCVPYLFASTRPLTPSVRNARRRHDVWTRVPAGVTVEESPRRHGVREREASQNKPKMNERLLFLTHHRNLTLKSNLYSHRSSHDPHTTLVFSFFPNFSAKNPLTFFRSFADRGMARPRESIVVSSPLTSASSRFFLHLAA